MTGQINNQVLLGNEFGKARSIFITYPIADDKAADNAEFTKAAISYNEDVVVAMELCRQIPTFLVPYVVECWPLPKIANHQKPRCTNYHGLEWFYEKGWQTAPNGDRETIGNGFNARKTWRTLCISCQILGEDDNLLTA